MLAQQTLPPLRRDVETPKRCPLHLHTCQASQAPPSRADNNAPVTQHLTCPLPPCPYKHLWSSSSWNRNAVSVCCTYTCSLADVIRTAPRVLCSVGWGVDTGLEILPASGNPWLCTKVPAIPHTAFRMRRNGLCSAVQANAEE